MKTLPSSCSTKAIHRNFIRDSSGFQNFRLNKPGNCFFPLEKFIKARYLCLIPVQRKASVAVRCSSLVPNSQVELDTAETQFSNAYQLKSVHVKFQLQKECSFGEHFFMVGDDPMVGLWDPDSALPLNWSDGHIWSIELEIPVGKSINFKFILKRINGSLFWQPGPDRAFQTWETENTITVLEDWEIAGYQKVTEETVFPEQDEELRDGQENEVLAENLTREEPVHGINQGADIDPNCSQEKMPVQAKSSSVAPNDSSPLLENPKPIIADNINLPTEDLLATQNDMLGEQGMWRTNQDLSVAMSIESMWVPDNVLECNGRAVTTEDHTVSEANGTLIIYEENPVLVPGLAPSSTAPTGGTTVQADDKATTIVGQSRVPEAKTHNSPELDEKQELNVDPVKAKLAEMSTGSGAQKVEHMSNEARKEKKDLESLEIHLSQDEKQEAGDKGNEVVDRQVNHKPLEAVKEEEDSEPFQSNPLQNDMQWGRRTLQKLLNNLGIL